jgi:hypothetical protein
VARGHGARRLSEVVRAFVDRRPIDWNAVADDDGHEGERGVLDALRRLERLRGAGPAVQEAEPARIWTNVLRVAVAVGTVQIVAALGYVAVAAAAGRGRWALAPHALVAVVFSASSLPLGSAVLRDHRIFFLLASFLLTAAAFSRAVVEGLAYGPKMSSSLLFAGIYPETFAQAAFWQFAGVFPSVRRFTRFDLFARRAASVAGVVASALFAANLLLAYGLLPSAFGVLGRDHRRDLFWLVFAAMTLPALAIVFVRACRAPWTERAKVVRFAGAILVGAAPVLAIGVARMWPATDAWMSAEGILQLTNAVVMTALAAMPICATLAVLVDAPFGRVAARARSVGAIERNVARLDALWERARHPRRHREQLAVALDRVRLARGAREIVDVLQQELAAAVHAGSVAIVPTGMLPTDSAIVAMLEGSMDPLDLAPDGELYALLPAADRRWLDASGGVLAAALRLRDGTIPAVAVIAPSPTGASFDGSDRWFIATLLTGASAAWESAASFAPDEECADECVRCGRLRGTGRPPCCGAAETRLAALPGRLGDRFLVIRRLGAGGMGIVYLGHDVTLKRDVALKTWSGCRHDTMLRLREEARVMATLSHDALAMIYGLERWRSTPILVIEYCARGTLAEVLARSPLPVGDALRLGIRLADALAYMHARGVLHRDVKPSNIGFTSTGAAKLMDFGLAMSDEHPAGTPSYLPPEALRGAPPDMHVDLWGLATVLREACGAAADDEATLGAFFARALAPQPEHRFQSSVEMRDELQRIRIEIRSSDSIDR